MSPHSQDHMKARSQGGRWFTPVIYAIQFFFGGWFLFHGSNYFLEFFTQPSGSSPVAHEVISALIHSGLFSVVKAIEVVVGIALLANRFVPLAAVAAFPVSFSIAFINLVSNGDAMSIVVANVVIAFNAAIAVGHMARFWPMLAFDQGDPSAVGLFAPSRAGSPAHFQPAYPAVMRGWIHTLCIIGGILAPIGVTLLTTRDGGFRSLAHYHSVEASIEPHGAD